MPSPDHMYNQHREKIETPEERQKVFNEYLEHVKEYSDISFAYKCSAECVLRFVKRHPDEFPDAEQRINESRSLRRKHFEKIMMNNCTGDMKGNAGVVKMMAYQIMKMRDAPQVVEQTVTTTINADSVAKHEKEVLLRQGPENLDDRSAKKDD